MCVCVCFLKVAFKTLNHVINLETSGMPKVKKEP